MKKILIPCTFIFLLFSCSEPEKSVPPYNVDEKLSSLEGLALGDFIDQSYQAYLEWFPQKSGSGLNSYDPDYIDVYSCFLLSLSGMLEEYESENRDYYLYRFFIDQLIAEQEAVYINFPLSLSGRKSYINSMLGFFSGSLRIESIEEAEEYINLLNRVYFQMEELDSFILRQEEMGVIMPIILVDVIYSDVRYYGRVAPESFPLYHDFKGKIAALGLESRDERKLLRKAKKAIEESVQMGFRLLERRIELQYDKAPQRVDLLSLPGGEKYYRDSFKRETWTSRSPEELFDLAIGDLEVMQSRMYKVFEGFGYDTSLTLFELFDRYDSESPYYKSDEVLDAYTELISESKKRIVGYFPSLPQEEVIVVEREAPGIFVPPSSFYASARIRQTYKLPSAIFQQVYPGNYVRWTLQQQLETHIYQQEFSSLAYSDGWALYADDFMDKLGYYTGDPTASLEYLKRKSLAAALLASDVGVNLKGWSITRATEFVSEYTGFKKNQANRMVSPALSTPGVKAAEYAGYLEFRILLEEQQREQGSSFDYARYHKELLETGPVPFDYFLLR